MVSSILFPAYIFLCSQRSGKSISLPPESEEVAGFYAAMLETDHTKDAVFNKNFFDDWKGVLKKYPPVCSLVLSCMCNLSM